MAYAIVYIQLTTTKQQQNKGDTTMETEKREVGTILIDQIDGDVIAVDYIIVEDCGVEACIGRVLGNCSNCSRG